MVQPIRKSVVQQRPELEKKPFYTLIVDGNNVLRRSMADTKMNAKGVHYGGIFQTLLQIRIMMQKKAFDYVYVVFDGHKSGLERYKLYNDYKANRPDKDYASMLYDEELSEYGKAVKAKVKSMEEYLFNKNKKEKTDTQKFIDENFARERDTLLKYFNELYIRWIFDDDESTEGDDYIAYYVKNKKPEEKIVIMSTDHDLTQLINENVIIYDQVIKQFITKDNIKKIRGIPSENVVVEKIFCGDTSDNIKNIDGVSVNRLHEAMPEMLVRPVTVDEIIERAKKLIQERVEQKKKPLKWQENIVNAKTKGNYDGNIYEINRKIIDLSNPLITEKAKNEMDSMRYVVQDPDGRSFNNLFKYIREDEIVDLIDEDKFATFFSPFKSLVDKEIIRYKNETEEK